MNLEKFRSLSKSYRKLVKKENQIKKVCIWLPVGWLIWFLVIGTVTLKLSNADPGHPITAIWALIFVLCPIVWCIFMFKKSQLKKDKIEESEDMRNTVIKILKHEYASVSGTNFDDTLTSVLESSGLPMKVRDSWWLGIDTIRYIEVLLLESYTGKEFSRFQKDILATVLEEKHQPTSRLKRDGE